MLPRGGESVGRLLGSLRTLLGLVAAPFGAPPAGLPRRLTRAEWLASSDLGLLLEFLGGEVSDRKLRLFAVACCRRVLDLLPDGRSRRAVDTFERYADGQAGPEELRAALRAAWDVGENAASYLATEESFLVAFKAAADRAAGGDGRESTGRWAAERAAQCDLLRDVCNPFRTGSAGPSWLTWNGAVVGQLAAALYEGRRFDDLPVLGDALEEAGCADAEILDHCRGPGPHVRGCWLIDLILQRT
jgi:hypothetical protein